MKIIFYNIAFGTGLDGSWKHYLMRVWRFLWTPLSTLKNIAELLRKERADIICLAEVDNGSFRSRFRCQATALAGWLKYRFFRTQNKYVPWSIWRFMTVVRNQHDAVLSHHEGEVKTHYLRSGMQRTVLEFIVKGVSIFVVHLAVLSRKVRREQMEDLAEIIKECPRPYLVCGDFNLHTGLSEIKDFIKRTKMKLVRTPKTFPSFKPNRTIDLFLSSPGLKVKAAGIIKAPFSDHLPVWVKLEH